MITVVLFPQPSRLRTNNTLKQSCLLHIFFLRERLGRVMSKERAKSQG